MNSKDIKAFWTVTMVAILLIVSAPVFGQQTSDTEIARMRTQADEFVRQNRYLDALPLLEKLSPLFPNDAELTANHGIAILVKSSTLQSPDERKAHRIRGYKVLSKAKELGTTNVLALHFLDQLTPNGGDDDNFIGDPEFEKNLRSGEEFFGRGEYDKAFAAYERAFKINPKSYEAVLFMGDSLYAAGKYKESEAWFAKAIEIEPNREQAYRFWGDALMFQNNVAAAGDKFVEALVSDPFSRLTWDRLGRWIEESGTKVDSLTVVPPGGKALGEIVIDEKLLKDDDGTIAWKFYIEEKRLQKKRDLAGEARALRRVASAVRAESKKIKSLDPGLANLVKIDDAGLLEGYILIVRADDEIASDYGPYLQKYRDKLRRTVYEVLLGRTK